MGIPSFFRCVLQENSNIISFVEKNSQDDIDYFFLDFNSIIYNVFAKNNFISEDILIQQVIIELENLCNNFVQPKKLLYIALDGTAPRAKMVQQRSRRYKSIQIEEILESLNVQSTSSWIPSNHICPGTSFMFKFQQEILKAIKKKQFKCPRVVYDGSLNPGEGEHKILPLVRALTKKESNSNVVIFSPDNDILSLSLLTQKKNVKILRYMDVYSFEIIKKQNHKNIDMKNPPMVYIEMNKLREMFRKTLQNQTDEENVILDYNFLLSIVGNDFILSLPFLKIRSGGLDLLIQIYNEIRNQFNFTYLIDKKTLHIDNKFFIEIIRKLSMMEGVKMRQLQEFMSRENQSMHHVQHEKEMRPDEIIKARLEHLYMFHRDHPLHNEYEQEFSKIDYTQPKHDWKKQYYKLFADTADENFNRTRTKMVHKYFESLMFTLFYYNHACPSWNWFYPFRAPPLFADMLTILERFKFDMNKDIRFQKGIPFQPLQQLSLILPPQSASLLPKECQPIMSMYPQYYPKSFRINAPLGLKYIYSEANLPEFDEFQKFMTDLKKLDVNIRNKPQFRSINKVYKFIF